MINLLPQSQQKEIRAARSNALLMRYIIMLSVAFVFLVGALLITQLSLDSIARQADQTKSENEQAAIGYSETQKAAATLRSELSTAKELFDKEIRYSKALLNLAALLPDGTAITGLSINSQTFSQPMVLSVLVRGEQQAHQLRANFSNSSHVTNVSMGRVSTVENGTGYPYAVELVFTLNRSIAQ